MQIYRALLDGETPEEFDRRVAYHEAGHAAVGLILTPDQVYGASIKPLLHRTGEISCGRVWFKTKLEQVPDLEQQKLATSAINCAGLIGESVGVGYYDEYGSVKDIIDTFVTLGLIAVEEYRRATGLTRHEIAYSQANDRNTRAIKTGSFTAKRVIGDNLLFFHALAHALLEHRELPRPALMALRDRYARPL